MADATHAPSRPRPGAANLSKVPYLPGLDGMRALAVIAVLIYHANSSWLSGGFLGVEVFFVISGYLITLLLMAEYEQHGSIDLMAFWMRRARRLLPALFLMMFLLLTYSWIFKSNVLGKLRGDMLGGFFYVSNWYQIWVGQGYSSAGDFAPLRHLWSLAVEEQFYLVWPLVMAAILSRTGTRRLGGVARGLIIGALGVTVVVAFLFHGGDIRDCADTPDAYWTIGERCISKADTLYLSTISRSGGLMLGAAFAMIWRPVAIMRGPLRHAGRLLDIIGTVGLLLLAFLSWKLHFLEASQADPWLFRGGFLLTSIATLMVIAAVTHRKALLGRLLGLPPLLWVGTRSYGLYLYSWPIYQIIRKVAGNPLTFNQFVVAMIATVAVSEVSYRLVETPIRRRVVGEWWSRLGRRRDQGPRRLVGFTGLAMVGVLIIGALQLGLADVQLNEIEQAAADNEGSASAIDDLLGGALAADDATEPTAPPVVTQPSTVPSESVAPDASTTTTSTTTTTTTTLPAEPMIDLFAIGDSVMLGAAKVLTDRGYTVDAQVSRQMADIIPIMQKLGDAELFGNRVIIHLGTNGPITAETLDAFLATLRGVPNVIMLNVRANRSWTASNNALLAARDRPNDNIVLVDWASLSNNCPGSCFAEDGIHLNAEGAKYYANLIGDKTGR